MEVKKKVGDDESSSSTLNNFFQSNLVTTHRDVSSLHKSGSCLSGAQNMIRVLHTQKVVCPIRRDLSRRQVTKQNTG